MTDDDNTGPALPASLELAWGLRGRPAKGPKPGLSLDQIVQAAIAVARAEGLDAVSMGRVAKELGASTMSLYRYVAAKNELLALMLDAGFGPPPPGPPADQNWRDGLTTWSHALLAGYRQHPWVRHVPISGPPMLPNQVRWMEYAIRLLRGTGLTGAEKIATLLALSGLVRNWAIISLDMAETAQAEPGTGADVIDGYEKMLSGLIDAERFPALTELFASEQPVDPSETDPDFDLDFGLERILDGIEALIRSRTTNRVAA
ncbi:TetR/AcrR family transcriptional regulator [Plantactinospora sp. GCM10030261]|uniref:TetR/AcrR family transcriptional regulator n=1 Tax=Plantactinospora sp. GCM10030261 TaxID=3273420 RepID=UPI003609649B